MAAGSRATPMGEEREPVGQPGEHAGERTVAEGGGRQLDGQRDPIEVGHDRGDVGGVVVGESEPGQDHPCPFHEEAHGVGLGRLGGTGHPIGIDGGQRLDPPHHLALDVERLAAGGENDDVRALT